MATQPSTPYYTAATADICPICRRRYPTAKGQMIQHRHCRHCGMPIRDLLGNGVWTNQDNPNCSNDGQRHEPTCSCGAVSLGRHVASVAYGEAPHAHPFDPSERK
jgi:hypothetical protein